MEEGRGTEDLLMNIKTDLHTAAALDKSERCEPRARGERGVSVTVKYVE